MNDDLNEEFRHLTMDEAAVKFIAQNTALSEERVRRIYALGQPWPLGVKYWEDLGQHAQKAGVDALTYMIAMDPLIGTDLREKEAKLNAFCAVTGRGGNPVPIAELGDPEVEEHLEKVATRTREEVQAVRQVREGLIALCKRLLELVQKQIKQMALRGSH